MQVKNNWKQFYKDRVNSGYQTYFNERYKPMIDLIKDINPKYIREEGIGIGSVSKSLVDTEIVCYGFDNNWDMLGLCQRNNAKLLVYEDCILRPKIKYDFEESQGQLVVTHGVLEHFTDSEILGIKLRYMSARQKRVHYVPLDKYKQQSFGDERLLSKEHWLSLLKPKDYILFNDNHDLLLIN